MQFGDFGYFFGKVVATTLVSFLLIFITEMLFFRKSRLRAYVT
jgi:hypothetical protein